jgi:hypothetical protein
MGGYIYMDVLNEWVYLKLGMRCLIKLDGV